MADVTPSAWRRLFGFFGLCRHEWGEDQDFVSSYTLTISTDPNFEPERSPLTISTLQWCQRCDKQRRKPRSARLAQGPGDRP